MANQVLDRSVEVGSIEIEDFEWCSKFSEPVLIKSAVNALGIEHWNNQYISEKFGNLVCRYSEDSNLALTELSCTTQQFLDSFYGSKDNYLFDFRFLTDANRIHDQLLQKISDNQFFRKDEVVSRALYIGSANTGVLPHEHRRALNFLVQGRKKWVMVNDTELTKKYLATYPKGTHARDWFENEAPHLESETVAEVFRFEQMEGDAVVIPGGFMHAVLNESNVTGIVVVLN